MEHVIIGYNYSSEWKDYIIVIYTMCKTQTWIISPSNSSAVSTILLCCRESEFPLFVWSEIPKLTFLLLPSSFLSLCLYHHCTPTRVWLWKFQECLWPASAFQTTVTQENSCMTSQWMCASKSAYPRSPKLMVGVHGMKEILIMTLWGHDRVTLMVLCCE